MCKYMMWIVVLVVIVLVIWMWNWVEGFEEGMVVWTYWEGVKPEYIDLCFDSMRKYCDRLIILDDVSVHNYLPELRELGHLKIAQKVDYIRVALLYHYGGVWVDADTIVMRRLDEIFEKVRRYDYVGFGCSDKVCFNGYPRPSNGVMGSKKGGKLMGKVLGDLDRMLDGGKEFEYFDLGKLVLWRNIKELMEGGYSNYYHYGSEYDGSRDKLGKWISVKNHIAKVKTEFLDERKLFFVFLENNKFASVHKWFSELKKEEVLKGGWWISELFRKSLMVMI